MDHLDSQYQAVADLAGIPPTVLHRLKPDEMRVLACVAEHRDRIVAQPELALHVFGKAGDLECRRIGNMLRSVRFAVCRYVTIAVAFTNYRGKLAMGVRWEPNDPNDQASVGCHTRVTTDDGLCTTGQTDEITLDEIERILI